MGHNIELQFSSRGNAKMWRFVSMKMAAVHRTDSNIE